MLSTVDRTLRSGHGVRATGLDGHGGGPHRHTPADEMRTLGELLPRWGVHRVLWGSDNMHGALDLTRTQWPPDAGAWRPIAEQRGTALVAAV